MSRKRGGELCAPTSRDGSDQARSESLNSGCNDEEQREVQMGTEDSTRGNEEEEKLHENTSEEEAEQEGDVFKIKLPCSKKQKRYHCLYCDKSFYNSGNLNVHHRVHTGEKPYKCSHCDKTFTQSGQLKYHSRKHTEERAPEQPTQGAKKARRGDGVRKMTKRDRCKDTTQTAVVMEREQVQRFSSTASCDRQMFSSESSASSRSWDPSCTKSLGTELSMEDIEALQEENQQLRKRVAALVNRMKRYKFHKLRRKDAWRQQRVAVRWRCGTYLSRKLHPTSRQVEISGPSGLSRYEPSPTESLVSDYSDEEQQQQLAEAPVKMCSVQLVDCRMGVEEEAAAAEGEILKIVLQRPKSSKISESPSHVHSKKEKRYHCLYCDKSFYNSGNLNAHHRIHTGEKPFKCSYCDKSFIQSGQLKYHERKHTGENAPEPQRRREGTKELCPCPYCGKRFPSRSHVVMHQRIHTGERPYTCSHCGKSFRQMGRLRAHERLHTGERPFACSQCGKSFNEKKDFKLHQTVHTKEKPYLCSVCGKSFARPDGLYFHQKIHSDVRTHFCSLCGKSFIRLGALKNHQRTHSDEKPYLCPLCGKSFKTPPYLQKHIRTHSGERPYSCSLCGESFSRSDNLVSHEKRHSGERVHECPLCDKTFILPELLVAHQEVHTGEKAYRCTVCGESFNYSGSLLIHQKKHKTDELGDYSQHSPQGD